MSGIEYAIFDAMRRRLLNILALSLPLQWVLIRWLARYPEWVEEHYSLGLYPHISGFFRRLYGWIPFSVGDLLYGFLLSGILWVVYQHGRRLRTHFRESLRNLLAGLAVLHLTFYLLWGLNYFRQPLSERMGLEEAYDEAALLELVSTLIQEVNALQEQLTGGRTEQVVIPYDREDILNRTLEAYRVYGSAEPAFRYIHPSLKPSLISLGLSYMGYGGYLNPFTGEAQVNARLPLFRFPVVCAHEVGHQLGYSAENETNFIGYLLTRSQDDPYMQYSAAAYALGYCLAEVRRRDPTLAKSLVKELNAGVLANYAELRTFWESYQNPMEPVFKAIFNQYLEANLQKDGIRSYNRVVGLMIGYHKKVPVRVPAR